MGGSRLKYYFDVSEQPRPDRGSSVAYGGNGLEDDEMDRRHV